MEGIIPAWGRILTGYTPALSIEITRECPLRCPGCYAYGDDHLGGEVTLRQVRDFKGQELVDGVLGAGRQASAAAPLDRRRRAAGPLPGARTRCCRCSRSAASTCSWSPAPCARFPTEWHGIPRFTIVVSIDGLQPEHDARRTPATYERILKHIVGHQITVHCTVTRQQMNRPGYLEEFLQFWSAQAGGAQDLDEPVHAAGRRGLRRAADACRIASGWSPICWRCGCATRSSRRPRG